MKKISRLMAVLFICLCTLLFPTACGDVEIESGMVVPGTLETIVVTGDQVDTSKVVVKFTYSDDKVVTVTADELEFSTVDTSTVTENAKLTISYDGFSFDVTIRVRASEDDVNDIREFTSMSQDTYNDNITTNALGFYNHEYVSTDTEEGAQEKYLGIEPRYVGTDNPFVLDLQIAGYDANDNEVDGLMNVSTNIKVELINNDGSKTELTEESTPKLSDMVTVSSLDATFDFTDAAEGKAFFVTVEPKNKALDAGNSVTITAELHVIEGFNVHNAKELSVYDNSGRDYDFDGVADWNGIKAEIGVAANYVPENIILQNNINITDSDVPSTMFWSDNDYRFEHWKDDDQRYLSTTFDVAKDRVKGLDEKGRALKLEGSMVDRDFTGVYHHNFTTDGGSVNLIGNYFTVSCKDLSRAVVEGRGAEDDNAISTVAGAQQYMEMHASLFCHTYMDEQDDPATDRPYVMTNDCDVNWKNINFTGNGAVSDAAQYSGSIILHKTYRINSNIYNCVSTNFAINYIFAFGESDCEKDGEYRIDYCKGNNSYQALVFSNGAEHTVISNSEFKSACGPAIISVLNGAEDWDKFKDGDTTKEHEFYISKMDIINSSIESLVSGQEPWFKYYKADQQVGQVTSAETLLNGSALGLPFGTAKTIVQDTIGQAQQFNLQVLSMRDGAIDFNNPKTNEGYVRFFGANYDKTKTAQNWADYVNYYDEDNTEEDVEFGLVMNGEYGQKPLTLGGLLVIEDDNGTWFNAEFGQKDEHENVNLYASDDLKTIVMALMGGNNEAALDYQQLFAESNFLDFYLPNGMGCRVALKAVEA